MIELWKRVAKKYRTFESEESIISSEDLKRKILFDAKNTQNIESSLDYINSNEDDDDDWY